MKLANWDLRTAILMYKTDLDFENADKILAENDFVIQKAIESIK